jgi:hypothetical protein
VSRADANGNGEAPHGSGDGCQSVVGEYQSYRHHGYRGNDVATDQHVVGDDVRPAAKMVPGVQDETDGENVRAERESALR